MCKPPNDHHFETMEYHAECACGAFRLAWTVEAVKRVETVSRFRGGDDGRCVSCNQPYEDHTYGECPKVLRA